jgi:HEAT repeat protein
MAFEVPAPPTRPVPASAVRRNPAPRPRPAPTPSSPDFDYPEPSRRPKMLLLGLLSVVLVGLIVLVPVLGVGVYLLRDQWASAPPKDSKASQRTEVARVEKPAAPPDKPAPKDKPLAVKGEQPREKPAESSLPKRSPEPAPKRDAELEPTPHEETPKTEPAPKAETPKPAAPAKVEPAKVESPKTAPPKDEPAKAEPPKIKPMPKVEEAKPDKPEKTKPTATPPRTDVAKADPPPKTDTRREEPPRREEAPAIKTAAPLPPERRLSGDEIFSRLVKSSVLIMNGKGWGSGSLIHAERRLILTNYHVVGDNSTVDVSFPCYDNSGKLIVDGDYYLRAYQDKKFLRGTVLKRAKDRDLAVVRLDKLPEDTPALKLAAHSASTGQTVYSVGNAGASEARWQFVTGTVRQVHHYNWDVQVGRKILSFDADIVETTSPTNPGDSGGPLVNDKLQLVAVTQGANVKARELSIFIDIGEVKNLLKQCDVNLADVVASPDDGPEGLADAATIADLIKHLHDEDTRVRAEAARRLAAIGPEAKAAAPALKKLLKSDDEPEVRRNAALALGRLGPEMRNKVRRDVFAALRDSDNEVRQAVLQALANLGAPEEHELEKLLSFLHDARRRQENKACVYALKVLAGFGPQAKEAVSDLRELLKSENREVRAQVLATLRKIGPAAAEAAPDLVEFLKDSDPSVRMQAALALLALDPQAAGSGREALSVLILTLRPETAAELKDATYQERVKETRALLVKIGQPAAERLLRAIEGEFRASRRRAEASALNAAAREAALKIIADIGPNAYSNRMLTALVELQRSDPSRAVRDAAQEAHIKIQGGN